MARKQAQRPSWFKLWLRDKPLIAALPDEVAGKALKDALDYFETGEVPELDQLGSFAFALFKTGVDEANKDYQLSVESGRAGGQKAWAAVRKKSDTPPIPPLYHPYTPTIGVHTEGEVEVEVEVEGESVKADKPPARPRFSPPSVDAVTEYCKDHGYSVDAEHFVSYYQSNGWMVGKNKMKDWKAAIRSWSRRENAANGETKHQPSWTTGVTV